MSSGLVDWDLALATARRLVPPGPRVSFEEAAALVNSLRDLTVEAETQVRSFTGLAAGLDPGPPDVVDRPQWVANNLEGFQVVLGPLVDQLADRRRRGTGGAVIGPVGARVTGLEVGAVMAYLGSKVLGQYEIFLPPGQGVGRLSLVAPNILAAERAMNVDPRDFRLWVCVHESTHRTQFVAVPWLRDHFITEVTALLEATDLDPAAMVSRLRAAVGSVRSSGGGLSLLEAVQTPEQRAILDRLTALMSLLEGHAEYVMDGVGPGVIPSVATIRQRFDARRHGGSPLQKFIRRVLGIDLKLRQYADGSSFVRAVAGAVGRDGLNRVWESPATLPTRAEIHAPSSWVARVHGAAGELPAASA